MAQNRALKHSGAMSEYTTQPIATVPSTKRLERPASGRIITGVAAGLGRYFDLNPAFFRLGFIVLTLLGGSGVLVYLAALLIMPEEGKEQSIAGEALAQRREHPWQIVGLGLAGVALAVLISRSTFWPVEGAGWVLILIAGLAILWTHDAKRGDRRSRYLVRGLIVILALALATITAAVVTAFAWFHISLGAGTGDRSLTPTAISDLHPSYHLGVGTLRLNLSQLPPITQETHLKARVDVGRLRIVVPANTAVTVNAHVKVGDIRVFRQQDSGHNASVQTGNGPLVIDARVGAGKVEVVRPGG
jgi:phage shock protein PspC (stress-responsive transcriptional regulator)